MKRNPQDVESTFAYFSGWLSFSAASPLPSSWEVRNQGCMLAEGALFPRACVFNRLCSCEYVNMWYCFFYQFVSSTRHPPPSRAKAAKKALPRPRRGPESAVYFIQIRHQLRISSHHNQPVKVRTYRCGARVYQR